MSGINLIPPERARVRLARIHRRLWLRVWIVTLVIVGITAGWMERTKNIRAREASDLRGRYSLLQEQVRLAENLIRERERLERRRAAVGVIREDHPAALLLELTGESLPEAAHLSFFRFERGQASSEPEEGAEPARLVLRGEAPGHHAVGTIMRNLRDSGAFRSVRLVSVSDVASGSEGLGFEVACTIESGWADG